jgi:peroxiredoxin
MLHLILSLALAPAVVSTDAALTAPMQLSYRGSIDARGEEPDKPRKTFDLTLWIIDQKPSGAELFWLVDERGRGEFLWSEHFGRLAVDPRWRTAAAGPALLYDRGDGRSVVPLALPFLAGDVPLAAGGSFHDDKLEFQVEKISKVAEQPAWKVNVRDSFGPKRTVWVDQRGPLVLNLTERVIMGRGDEYQLKLELVGTEPVAADQLAALTKTIEKLTALRARLNLPQQSQEVEWKSDQLAILREQLPELATMAASTPLTKLVTAAQRDFELQSGRSHAVAELNSKFDGQRVEHFSLKGLGSDALSLADLQGHVTVIHFWDYRDEPLKEPYGQVGYLEFMYHRRKPDGLRLYGIAVDGRFADEKTRSAAERGVRKLKSFMNLSYPLLFDSGALVKQFGDPRLLGASLPLFVVIGPDQKILHYHVGNYEVHQDQGLKELDQVVAKALEGK